MSAGNREMAAPGPRGQALLGSLLDIRRDRLGFLMTMTQQFGGIVSFRMGRKILYLVNDPDSIQHVLQANAENYRKGLGLSQAKVMLGNGLLTSEGEEWAQRRHLLKPFFQGQAIARYAPVMVETTGAMLERWRTCAVHGKRLDLAVEMDRLMLMILCRTLIVLAEESDVDAIRRAFTVAHHGVVHQTFSPIRLPRIVPTPQNARFRRALLDLDRVADKLLDERRRQQDVADVVQALLRAQSESTGTILSDTQLRDEIVTLLFTGHETAASSLMWTLYCVSRNPSLERLLRSEVTGVLAGRSPNIDDLSRLSYTRMVIEESMRLYPPVWMITRRAVADDEVGAYRVPAGSDVLISPYAAHRHPAFWSKPEVFDPERFVASRPVSRPRYTYLPFGGGPRYCIGSNFAMIEAMIVLAMIIQRYHLDTTADQSIEMDPMLTLRSRHSIEAGVTDLLNVERRRAGPHSGPFEYA